MSRVAVVLAAGESKRLGQPKQLLELEGETLIRRAIRSAKESGARRVSVVIGSSADEMEQELADVTQVTILRNSQWRQGMGTSVACGAQAVLDSNAECDSLLLMVCDQPFVSLGHLRALFNTVENDSKIAATGFPDGTLGIPVCFPVRYLRELAALSGPRGAKSIIESEDAVALACPEADIDIDTPSDLERLRS